MNVTFEKTPNPDCLKFNLGFEFNKSPFSCTHISETDCSPLAYKLFEFPWTSEVFVGTNFITLKKQDWVEWNSIATDIANFINEQIVNNEPLVVVSQSMSESEIANLSLDEISTRIKLILENEIRPSLASDGGDIDFISYGDGILKVELKGACKGCPSSTQTLKQGIEGYLQELIPDLKKVISI